MAHAIGELSYISGLPISLPMTAGYVDAGAFRRVEGLPGDLDDMMYHGDLAAAPISSLEYARHAERYTLLPNLTISSWGRFGSATLFSHVPFAQLTDKRVALPKAGATSNVLVQWVLAKMFGAEPFYEEAEGTQLMSRYDAALVIGDMAITEARNHTEYIQLDLGAAWYNLMQTPMVHTVWACQAALPEAEKAAIAELFTQAKAAGLAHMPDVIATASERLGVPVSELEGYYQLLNYDRTPVHDASLQLFGEFVHELVVFH